MHRFVRRTTLLAAAAMLAGCSLNSSTPTAQPASPAVKPGSLATAAVRPQRTKAIYSSSVAFVGSDGRHYAGDVVVFPDRMFPTLRVPGLATTGSSVAPHVAGALSYYLEVPDVQGGSTDRGYQKWIDVNAFSIGYGPSNGIHHPVTDLTIQKVADVASPDLLGGVFTNRPFNGTVPNGPANIMELDVTQVVQNTGQAAKTMYFTFTKPDATSFTTSYTGGALVETVTIGYEAAKFCVVPTNEKGQPQQAVCNTWTPSLAKE